MRCLTTLPATLLCLVVLMGIGYPRLLRAQDDSEVIPKDEIVADENLAGIWNVEAVTNKGEKLKQKEIESSQVVVREGSITVYDGEKNERYRCTYTFDRSSEPWKINMVAKLPGKPEAESKGIYKIKDDTWVLCYAYPGADRPEEFKSPKDSSQILVKMKRPEKVE